MYDYFSFLNDKRYFLKSLPEDSYYNVISFGSDYESLYEEKSMKYSDEALESALDVINSKKIKINLSFVNNNSGYDADLGGTELYEPLIAAYSLIP